MAGKWLVSGACLILSGCLSTGGGGGDGNGVAGDGAVGNPGLPQPGFGIGGGAPTAHTAGAGPRHGSEPKRASSPSATRTRAAPRNPRSPRAPAPDSLLTAAQQDRLNGFLGDLRRNLALSLEQKQEILRGLYSSLKEAKQQGEPIDDALFDSYLEQSKQEVETVERESTLLTEGSEEEEKEDTPQLVRASADPEEADDTPVKEIERSRALR